MNKHIKNLAWHVGSAGLGGVAIGLVLWGIDTVFSPTLSKLKKAFGPEAQAKTSDKEKKEN